MNQIITRAEAKRLGLKRYFTGEPCPRGHVAERTTANGSCHQCQLDDRRRKRASKPGHRTRAELDAIRNAPTRQCSACQKWLPSTEEFFVMTTKRHPTGTISKGLARECRICHNKRYPIYYHGNAAQREMIIARATDSTRKRREHPEVREANRIAAREAKRKTYADTPEKRVEDTARNRQWRHDNPDRTKLFKWNQPHLRAMRAMERYAAEVQATPAWADRDKIAAIYETAARLTRETGIKHHVDHIYPIMGKTCCGLHVEYNLRVTTAEINQSKSNKIPLEFNTWAQWEKEYRSHSNSKSAASITPRCTVSETDASTLAHHQRPQYQPYHDR